MEALRLSVYFEETGAYYYRKNKEAENQTSNRENSLSVEESVPDDEDDEE